MPSSSRKKRKKHSTAGFNTPEEKARRRATALKNPYFNGEKNGELHTKDKWTEEHREKVRQRMIKYNKSKAGRGQIAWHLKHPEARIEHAEKHFQPHNNERHRQAEQRKSIKWYREEYKKGIKPIIKPLPDQPQEYYDELDEFFAEGL